MEDGRLDFATYSERDLQEALTSIDRYKYPLNWAHLTQEWTRRKAQRPPAVAPSPKEPFRPNHIPINERNQCIWLSVLLVLYGAYGIYVDDLYLPARRGAGVHLHGNASLVMYAAMICATLAFLSIIADHYDERNNEDLYAAFAGVMFLISIVLYFVAFFL